MWDMGERYRARETTLSSSSNSSTSGAVGSAAGGAAASMLFAANVRGTPWEVASARQLQGEAKPLISRARPAVSKEDYADCARWAPALSNSTTRWSLFVASAFADMAPYNLLACTEPAGDLVTSVTLLTVFGALSLYTARLVTLAMTLTGQNSLVEVWREVMGRRTAWIPLMCSALVCFACCTAIASLYGSLFAAVMPPPLLLPSSPARAWIVLLAIFPVSIMVMLKDVSAMWFSTMLACLSGLLTAVVMVTRALDGTYARGGRFGVPMGHGDPADAAGQAQAHLGPGPRHSWRLPRRSLQPVCVMSVAFLMHFNVAKYYRELHHTGRAVHGRGLGLAMAGSMLVVLACFTAEHSTFGWHRSPDMILQSYSAEDTLINVARVMLGIGLMGCFGLVFAGLREALIDFLNEQLPNRVALFETVGFQNLFSLALLVAVTISACLEGEDFMASSAARATCGSLMVYVIPCVLFERTTRKYMIDSSMSCMQRTAITSIGIFGLALAFLSVIVFSYPITRS